MSDTSEICSLLPFTWICTVLSFGYKGFNCINLIGRCIVQTAVHQKWLCVLVCRLSSWWQLIVSSATASHPWTNSALTSFWESLGQCQCWGRGLEANCLIPSAWGTVWGMMGHFAACSTGYLQLSKKQTNSCVFTAQAAQAEGTETVLGDLSTPS